MGSARSVIKFGRVIGRRSKVPILLNKLADENQPNIFNQFGKAVSEATDGKSDEQLEADLAAGQELLARLQAAMNGNREVRAALAAEVTGQTALAALDEEHAALERQHFEIAFVVAVLTVVLENRRNAARTPPASGG